MNELFTNEFLQELFPRGKDDEFFDALYGGAEEGAFDISLTFGSFEPETGRLILEYRLTERPGKCMACSLTYGLPQVMERHPIIDLKGTVEKICQRIGPCWSVEGWTLGRTTPYAPKVNVIPFILQLKKVEV
jgi:hypothetical protein